MLEDGFVGLKPVLERQSREQRLIQITVDKNILVNVYDTKNEKYEFCFIETYINEKSTSILELQ